MSPEELAADYNSLSMHFYEHPSSHSDTPRSHPWTDAESDPSYRYYDFRQYPQLIRTHLEDFVPWSSYKAIDTFYSLLEWLNGVDSVFESNDCAFNGPDANTAPGFHQSLVCSGRLMIIFRTLQLNVSRDHVRRLHNASHHYLRQTDPHFECGAIGTTIMKVNYIAFPGSVEPVPGEELMLSFWAFGDSETETMINLERTFRNLWTVLRDLSDEIREETVAGTVSR